MSKYLLDTDICIYSMKGMFSINEKIQSIGIEHCYISEITVLELTYGVENSHDSKKANNQNKLKSMLKSMKVVPLNTCMHLFAKEKVNLKRQGNLIDNFDLIIGCTAVANDMILVTRNTKHFQRIHNIRIENWATS